MKKLINILTVFALIFTCFGITAYAEEPAYEKFDFVVEETEGAKVLDAKVAIFVSTSENKDKLTDKTEEFNIEGLKWKVRLKEDGAEMTDATEDTVFEDDKEYIIEILISAKNGADINVWDTNNAMFNGVPVEKTGGECRNNGTQLMIRAKTGVSESDIDLTESENSTVPNGNLNESGTLSLSKRCKVCGICPVQPLGVCLFIWIATVVAIIIIAAVVIIVKKKKK